MSRKQRSELSSDALQIAGLLRIIIEEGWTVFKFKKQRLHSSPKLLLSDISSPRAVLQVHQ